MDLMRNQMDTMQSLMASLGSS
eukprot:COSAG06_NODE_10618_length_1648_cov_0.830213_3_plen_21_part_01